MSNLCSGDIETSPEQSVDSNHSADDILDEIFEVVDETCSEDEAASDISEKKVESLSENENAAVTESVKYTESKKHQEGIPNYDENKGTSNIEEKNDQLNIEMQEDKLGIDANTEGKCIDDVKEDGLSSDKEDIVFRSKESDKSGIAAENGADLGEVKYITNIERKEAVLITEVKKISSDTEKKEGTNINETKEFLNIKCNTLESVKSQNAVQIVEIHRSGQTMKNGSIDQNVEGQSIDPAMDRLIISNLEITFPSKACEVKANSHEDREEVNCGKLEDKLNVPEKSCMPNTEQKEDELDRNHIGIGCDMEEIIYKEVEDNIVIENAKHVASSVLKATLLVTEKEEKCLNVEEEKPNGKTESGLKFDDMKNESKFNIVKDQVSIEQDSVSSIEPAVDRSVIGNLKEKVTLDEVDVKSNQVIEKVRSTCELKNKLNIEAESYIPYTKKKEFGLDSDCIEDDCVMEKAGSKVDEESVIEIAENVASIVLEIALLVTEKEENRSSNEEISNTAESRCGLNFNALKNESSFKIAKDQNLEQKAVSSIEPALDESIIDNLEEVVLDEVDAKSNEIIQEVGSTCVVDDKLSILDQVIVQPTEETEKEAELCVSRSTQEKIKRQIICDSEGQKPLNNEILIEGSNKQKNIIENEPVIDETKQEIQQPTDSVKSVVESNEIFSDTQLKCSTNSNPEFINSSIPDYLGDENFTIEQNLHSVAKEFSNDPQFTSALLENSSSSSEPTLGNTDIVPEIEFASNKGKKYHVKGDAFSDSLISRSGKLEKKHKFSKIQPVMCKDAVNERLFKTYYDKFKLGHCTCVVEKLDDNKSIKSCISLIMDRSDHLSNTSAVSELVISNIRHKTVKSQYFNKNELKDGSTSDRNSELNDKLEQDKNCSSGMSLKLNDDIQNIKEENINKISHRLKKRKYSSEATLLEADTPFKVQSLPNKRKKNSEKDSDSLISNLEKIEKKRKLKKLQNISCESTLNKRQIENYYEKYKLVHCTCMVKKLDDNKSVQSCINLMLDNLVQNEEKSGCIINIPKINESRVVEITPVPLILSQQDSVRKTQCITNENWFQYYNKFKLKHSSCVIEKLDDKNSIHTCIMLILDKISRKGKKLENALEICDEEQPTIFRTLVVSEPNQKAKTLKTQYGEITHKDEELDHAKSAKKCMNSMLDILSQDSKKSEDLFSEESAEELEVWITSNSSALSISIENALKICDEEQPTIFRTPVVSEPNQKAKTLKTQYGEITHKDEELDHAKSAKKCMNSMLDILSQDSKKSEDSFSKGSTEELEVCITSENDDVCRADEHSVNEISSQEQNKCNLKHTSGEIKKSAISKISHKRKKRKCSFEDTLKEKDSSQFVTVSAKRKKSCVKKDASLTPSISAPSSLVCQHSLQINLSCRDASNERSLKYYYDKFKLKHYRCVVEKLESVQVSGVPELEKVLKKRKKPEDTSKKSKTYQSVLKRNLKEKDTTSADEILLAETKEHRVKQDESLNPSISKLGHLKSKLPSKILKTSCKDATNERLLKYYYDKFKLKHCRCILNKIDIDKSVQNYRYG